MRPLDERPVAEVYRGWADRECDDSPAYRAWGRGVAGDPEVAALVATLPAGKRQPNLVFAAARWHGADPSSYDGLRAVLLDHWDDVRGTVLTRATQTNEVGRCATLLPVLATLPGPLALLEVGCSAGLTLFPDRYGYRWGGDRERALEPEDGPSPVRLRCEVVGDPPLPDRFPDVVWRGGLDLNPLDVRDDDAMRWLEMLVWPEHDERRERLAAAVALAREDPPVLRRGDLLADLPALLDEVPAGATTVVFHSAVAAYLGQQERARFAGRMRELVGGGQLHWLANEGPEVLPGIDVPEEPAGTAVGSAPFLLSLDGEAVGWTHGHGQALAWIDGVLGSSA